MRKLTAAWTEQHVPVALALVVTTLAGAVAALEPVPESLVAVGAVVLTAMGALFLDAFGGIVLGVAVSAAVVLQQRLTGTWTADSFATSLALVLGLVTVGWLTGMVSAGIHARRRGDGDEAVSLTPAYGSLGLLTRDVAFLRLEEEVSRARRHDRPLTVAVLKVAVTDPSLDPAAREAALRAVARLVESQLRDTDVPFALESDEVGAILPETGVAAAWEVLGPVIDAATRAAFTVREQDERRSLVDCAEIHVGLSSLGPGAGPADALVTDAQRAARAEETETDVEPAAPPGASR